MNFAGKSGSQADLGPSTHGYIDSLPKGGDTVTVPDAHLLFSGDFARSGTDLIISDHLHRVVVPNYFNGDKRPALVSAEGAPLDPKVIDVLTGHVQYAQAAGTAATAKVVGHVVKMTGSASIVRNGVTIDVNNGDNVYQNDVVQTASASTLGLVMIDGTTFNLTANARLMMNDLTYDAASTSNTSLFTLVQGAATFVAGQVAKTGDMKVSTPVATMGIRGTAVILDISAIDGSVSVSVVNQRDGQVHAVQVYNSRGDLIGTVTSNGSTLTLRPTATFEVIAQESNKTVAQVLTEFNAFQQLLSTYDIGKQLVPNTPAPTDGRRGDNTQQPLTKFAGSTISPIDTTTTKFNAEVGGARDLKGDAGAGDAPRPTGALTDPVTTKIAFKSSEDAPVQFVEVAATSIPFVVTPSPVSRISSGSGDHFGPVMSADGQFVTYDPDGAIYLFDRQTGATRTIASPGGSFTYGSPTISSDGHFIVYQGSDGTQSWIFIYNNDASDPAHYGQISRLMSGGQPAISGDGSKLVVERGGSIGLYDQQGHELANITGAAVGVTGTLWKPAISADGHIIAFWSSDRSSPGGAGQLFTYDLSTATVRSIGSTATDAGNSAASFSADGHYVVYQSDAPGGHSEIYLYDLRAGEVVFHTANPGPSYNPVLSPDGHFIILASDARLTADDRNAVTDIYIIDVTDLSHPAYKLVSVLDDGTQGDDASNLGAAISAGGQFIAFGSRASNFSSGDAPGTGDIFVVDPTSGHSAIILESRNSPAVLTTSGVIKLTGDHSGITLGVSDSRLTASFDSHGDIQWNFSEPRSDFASLQPGQISVLNFVITLRTDRSTTEIPVKVSIYDVDQPAVPVADAAPVASPVTLTAGTEDSGYTITSAALLAGVVDIDGPSLSITAVGILNGGGTIVENHNGTFSYTPAPNYHGPVVFNYTASDGTLSASSTASLNVGAVNDAPSVTKARFAVSEGSTVVLNAAAIGVADPDSASFTFTVSNVTHGKFQTTADGSTWVDATTFAAGDLGAGHVRFVHDGGEDAPTFSIQVDDGAALNHVSATVAGTVDFTNVNDAPLVAAALTSSATEGGSPVTLDLLTGASDADGGTLAIAGVFALQPGLSLSGSILTIDPTNILFDHLAKGAAQTITLHYSIVDGHGGATLQTAEIKVFGTNDAPFVSPVPTIPVFEDGPAVTVNAMFASFDPDDGTTLSVTDLPGVLPDGVTFDSVSHVFTLDPTNAAYQHLSAFSLVTVTVSYGVTDGIATTADSVTFVVLGTNDAPILTAATLAAVDEDTTNPAGRTVSEIFGNNFQDVDDNSSLAGIAVVGNNATPDQGVWQYMSPFSGTWEDIGTVSESEAIALNATAKLRFVPAHDFNGTPGSIEVRGLDNTYHGSFTGGGAGGGRYTINTTDIGIDPLGHGGSTPISAQAVTLSTSVTPVNHAPVAVADTGVSITQNGGVDVSFSPILNASATGVGGEYAITQPINNQVGALWSDSKISLNKSFAISAELFFGANDGGADGFSFIIQNQSKTAIGDVGGGLGYEGIAHSVAIEFDTWDNGSGFNDIPDDHAAFDINGSMSGIGGPIDLGNIEDGQYHQVAIDWNAATHVITLSYDGVVIATRTVDVAATVGSTEAYIGFAGSTGAANNLQKIRNLSYQSADDSVVLDVLANDTDVDPGDKATLHVVSAVSASGATLAFSGLPGAGIAYSPGDVFKYLAAGQTATDTVTYTMADSHGAQATSTAEVTIVGLNDAPVIQGGDSISVSVAENATAVGTVVANDPDGPSPTYSIVTGSGSPDASKFTINSETGVLSFIHAPDFEHPTDSNHNNVYTVEVRVSDGDLADTQTIFVHVNDVNDAPHAINDIVITNNANNSTYQIPNWALLANDTDPDGNALNLTAITASSEFASIDLTTNPGNVTIHDLFVGGSFTYRASDGSLSDTANATVIQDTGTMNGGFANEIFIGNSFGTIINANGGNDILIGNAGNDTLNGGSGNDTYVFGLHDGHDVINDSSGLDTIRIEASGHELTGLSFAEDTHDNLVIQVNGQLVTVNDHFDGDGNVGGLKFDGGAKYDGYDLGSDTYFLSNDSGFNRSGMSGNDVLAGDGSRNSISGGDGNDLLFGNADSDTLNGGSGKDLLVGGAGNDFMTGGPGNDTFVFAQGSGRDTVTDFALGYDKLDLAYDAPFDSSSFDSWMANHAEQVGGGEDILIHLDVPGPGGFGAPIDQDTILLQHVAFANLTVNDFILHPGGGGGGN